MAQLPEKAIEAAARALCRLAGNPENTKFEGKPMWQSYAPEARAALGAVVPALLDRIERLEAERGDFIDIPRMTLGPQPPE